GTFTMCCEWVRNAPSMAIAQGMRTRLSSATRYAIKMCSKASCGVVTHNSSQPISRSARASLCSTPNAPGSSNARLPTRNTDGNHFGFPPILLSSHFLFPTQGNDFAGHVLQAGTSNERMDVAPPAFLFFGPLDVPPFVVGVGFPGTGVVLELQFVHHHDAFR